MKMADAEVTAPAMYTILHGKKGNLKGRVSKTCRTGIAYKDL
jgi:hypothetical protein